MCRRYSDQWLVLSDVCEVWKKEKKNSYLAFLDISKAYVNVWRDRLWHKMRKYGVEEKFVGVYERLHSGVETREVLNWGRRWFAMEGRFRQGCPLSPLLFDFYLMGIAEELERAQLGVKLEGCRCGALMVADDVALVADTGRVAGYIGCGRGICVKVEDEV